MPLTNTPPNPPTHYLLPLYPAHQLLDSAGPLDILSTISKLPQGPNLTLTIAAEDLSDVNLVPVAPPGSPWALELSSEQTLLDDDRVGGTGFNVPLRAHLTFTQALADLRESGCLRVRNVYGDLEDRPIDVLLVPGGIGTRLVRIDKRTGTRTLNAQATIDFVREICVGGYVGHAVLTVCTGSDLLARTGLLEGRRACTNAGAFEAVKGRHGGVSFLRGRRWVRSLPGEGAGNGDGGGRRVGDRADTNDGKEDADGRGEADGDGIAIEHGDSVAVGAVDEGEKFVFNKEIWTSAGISAGMDLMLWFVNEVYGREFARGIARRLEYEWREGVGEGEVDPYYR